MCVYWGSNPAVWKSGVVIGSLKWFFWCTVKKQRSRSMEMRFFGLQTKLNKTFSEYYGIQKLTIWLIIFTRYFPAAHHSQVRPWCMHENNSPTLLSRAAEPKALRGCVGTLDIGYTKSGPLHRIAPFRAPITKLTRALAAHMATITNTPYLGTYGIWQS